MSRLDKISNNNNLVHSRTKEDKSPISLSWFYILIIFLLIIGSGYLIFFSGLLNINNYNVEGYDHPELVKSLILEETEDNFIKSNILFFPKNHLTNVLSGDPQIEDIIIKKKYPDTILVIIKETKPSIIWISAGDKYFISDRGEVLGEAADENLPEIFDAANIKPKIGERVASPTFINFIKIIYEKFEGVTGTKIARINIFDILSDVHVLSTDGWTVYLDSSKDIDTQLSNLIRVLEEAKKDGTKNIEYIDMRVKGKIFYK